MTTGGRLGFLTDHWRLKLLSAFLAVVLFGTVAFAQNPITVRTLHVPISSYQITDQNLVLINNYPRFVVVQVVGLADAINPLHADDVSATMDLSKVTAPNGPPQQVQVSVNVRTVAPGVTLQESSVPVLVTVDSITTTSLAIDVRDQTTTGVTVTGTVIHAHGTTNPVSTVSVTGASSIVDGLKAFVDLKQIEGNAEFPDAQVEFQDKTGKTIKWPPPTIPLGSVDIPSVDVKVTTQRQQQQEQIAAAIPPITTDPACGYAVAAVDVSPKLVTLTGDVGSLSAAGATISLNPVDITGATGTVVSRQKIVAPAGTTASPTTVTVTVTIRQVASCTPASPVPSPTPQPSPSP